MVYATKDKIEIKNVVKKVVVAVELETKRKVAQVHGDRGSEFYNQELIAWLGDKGITLTFSAPCQPEQNGIAESPKVSQ